MSEAWTGALAYTLQIYFDFSGYCDMAIGLSLIFGVRLPANFNSPYKAGSIIDFWRRWHMTLSRFLRDYLYIPMGGNRQGPLRRHVNLMVTMLLGGLWHGAGWTFVIWGALHGGYLVVNHLWRQSRLRIGRVPGWALTFVCVVFAWVFFRADSVATATRMIGAMLSFDGLDWPKKLTFPNELVTSRLNTWGLEMALLAIALALPNMQQLLARFRPVLDDIPHGEWPHSLRWRPTVAWGLATGAALVLGITLIGGESPFLYFQF
jgi:alginate O-acetyltransferase complex protein AlgI